MSYESYTFRHAAGTLSGPFMPWMEVVDDLHARVAELERQNAYLQAANCKFCTWEKRGHNFTEALTPSAETKAAYIGEFKFDLEVAHDPETWETMKVDVPWTTIKEIMSAIRARAERPSVPSWITDPVLIWSGEHRAYWRRNAQGYTTEISHAGIYSREDAIASTRHCGPEKKIEIRPCPGKVISAMCGESTLIAVYPDRGNVKKEGIKA